MTSLPFQLPPDLAACHDLIRDIWQENQQLQATVAGQAPSLREKDRKIAELEQTIIEQQTTIDRFVVDVALLKRAVFGRRRERYMEDPRQKFLFETSELKQGEKDDDPPKPKPKPPRRRTSKGRQRRVFPDFLPRTPVYQKLNEEDLPEELLNDPSTKRFFKKTGEKLEVEPAKLHVLEIYQEVIVRNEETGETSMITAARQAQLIDSFAGPSLLAYLTASRFADHLPYYRLEDILSRYGFRIGRSTQWRWMFALGERVLPLVDLMRARALQSSILGVDETPVTMLDRAAPGGSVTSYLWGTVGDRGHPYDCFYFTLGRSRDGPEEFLSSFRGYLQSDAYICYERIALAHEEIVKVACWTHARRKFEEVHFTGPTTRTSTALGYFQRIYDRDDRARELSDQQRYEFRQQEVKPLVASFQQWLLEHYEHELPKSKLRGAMGYMLNRWDAFERFLEQGAIPLDNNRTEASLKYAILGRKAWLFFGNPKGGQTAAALFTLTKSCNRHRIDPYAYLRDVYERLPTMSESQLETLLPDRWIQEHPEHLIQERVDEAIQRAERKRRQRAERRRQSA